MLTLVNVEEEVRKWHKMRKLFLSENILESFGKNSYIYGQSSASSSIEIVLFYENSDLILT